MMGIREVFRLAHKLKQPIFCGIDAFNTCAIHFNSKIEMEKQQHYEFANCSNVKIIKCPQMQDKSFFTCPFINFNFVSNTLQ